MLHLYGTNTISNCQFLGLGEDTGACRAYFTVWWNTDWF